MVSRLVSLLIAPPASMIGHLLFFVASGAAVRLSTDESGAASGLVPVSILLLGGTVLIGVAMVTAAWSALGVLVIGVIQVAIGTTVMFAPLMVGTDAISDDRSLIDQGLGKLVMVSPDFANGLSLAISTGFITLTGVLYIVVGLACRGRRLDGVARPKVARGISLLVAALGLLPGVVLVAVGGTMNFVAQYDRGRSVDYLGLIFAGAGILLLAVIVLSVRWSSWGAIVIGTILLAAGGAGILLPAIVEDLLAFSWIDDAIRTAVQTQVGTGAFALVGVLFLTAGISSDIADGIGLRREGEYVPAAEVADYDDEPVVEDRFAGTLRSSSI